MNSFYYAEQPDNKPLKVGDRARVLSHVPFRGGATGEVVEIDSMGFITLRFSDGQEIGYERDDMSYRAPKGEVQK